MSACNVVVDRETLIQLRHAIDLALGTDGGPEVPLAFDEVYYLESNPDVRAAVEDKIFRSGYEHYIRHGKAEHEENLKHGRLVRCPTRPSVPAPTPAPSQAAQWAPAEFYFSKQDLLDALVANRFDHVVHVDGSVAFNENGFGPPLQYWTWPDNGLRLRKPPAPDLRSSYGSVGEMLKHAKQIGWAFAIVVDGNPVLTGFEADNGASQYETVNGVIVRAR